MKINPVALAEKAGPTPFVSAAMVIRIAMIPSRARPAARIAPHRASPRKTKKDKIPRDVRDTAPMAIPFRDRARSESIAIGMVKARLAR